MLKYFYSVVFLSVAFFWNFPLALSDCSNEAAFLPGGCTARSREEEIITRDIVTLLINWNQLFH